MIFWCKLPTNHSHFNLVIIKVGTVQCCYNSVNFLLNSHNRQPIARPWGQGMQCVLWVRSLIHVLMLSSQFHMWYRDKLEHVITALCCSWNPFSIHFYPWVHINCILSFEYNMNFLLRFMFWLCSLMVLLAQPFCCFMSLPITLNKIFHCHKYHCNVQFKQSA